MQNREISYEGFPVRIREDNLVSLSDLWKADGKPRKFRLSDWIRDEGVQNQLKEIAIGLRANYTKSSDGYILSVPGVLENIRGGKPGVQGVFADRDFAIGYARLLSEECEIWVSRNLPKKVILEDLTPELIFSLMQSDKEFPVDFDDAWEWIGYSYKKNAKESLFENFELNIDYIDSRFLPQKVRTPQGGRPSEKFCLTVDCFKGFCLMAGTRRGKQVRKYFIECEKALKEVLAREQQRWQGSTAKEIVKENHSRWQKRFEDEFFEEVYRVTGWKRTHSGHAGCMGGFIVKNIYDRFPTGTTKRLRTVNPKINGNRKRKHHQHLEDIGLKGLDSQKGAALATLRLTPANSPEKFKRNYKIATGQDIQLQLPIVDDNIR